MGYPLRYIPEGGGLVEVTVRTHQSRLLLLPWPGWTEAFVGAMARAQTFHPVHLHAFACLSNHAHWLLTVADAYQLAGFMKHLLTNLSKLAGRQHRWPGSLFQHRYRSVLVSEEPAAQIQRLVYILRHGVKEGLVARPEEWPGPHCVRALKSGKPLQGVWISRTAQWAARSRGEVLSDAQASTRHELPLVPIPCWAHWTPRRYRQQMRELVDEINTEARDARRRDGTRPMGVEAVLRQDPHSTPHESKHSPAPLVHAATQEARRRYRRAYAEFVAAFYEAVERWRLGFVDPGFPTGAFLPPPRGGPSG